jgi:hypothetical protein
MNLGEKEKVMKDIIVIITHGKKSGTRVRTTARDAYSKRRPPVQMEAATMDWRAQRAIARAYRDAGGVL